MTLVLKLVVVFVVSVVFPLAAAAVLDSRARGKE